MKPLAILGSAIFCLYSVNDHLTDNQSTAKVETQ